MADLPRIRPTELTKRNVPFDREGWLFELKYDGYRSVAYIADGKATLESRRGITFTRFPTLAAVLPGAIDASEAILDGEIVVLDEEGHPRFYDLMAGQGRPVFAAFDLLWLDGEDLRELPLWERKSLLETHLVRPFVHAFYVGHIETQGIALFRQAVALDLEGIVAKRMDAPYRSGRSGWVKIKNPRYSQAPGQAERFNRRR